MDKIIRESLIKLSDSQKKMQELIEHLEIMNDLLSSVEEEAFNGINASDISVKIALYIQETVDKLLKLGKEVQEIEKKRENTEKTIRNNVESIRHTKEIIFKIEEKVACQRDSYEEISRITGELFGQLSQAIAANELVFANYCENKAANKDPQVKQEKIRQGWQRTIRGKKRSKSN